MELPAIQVPSEFAYKHSRLGLSYHRNYSHKKDYKLPWKGYRLIPLKPLANLTEEELIKRLKELTQRHERSRVQLRMRAPLAVRQTMRATLVLGFEEAGEALGGVEAEMLLADDGVELQEALHSPHDVTGVAEGGYSKDLTAIDVVDVTMVNLQLGRNHICGHSRRLTFTGFRFDCDVL